MPKQKQKRQPQTSREIVQYARKQGGRVVEGSRHTKIYGPDGNGRPVAVPRHNGQLGPGLLSAIFRQLAAIGLMLFLFGIPVLVAVLLLY